MFFDCDLEKPFNFLLLSISHINEDALLLKE